MKDYPIVRQALADAGVPPKGIEELVCGASTSPYLHQAVVLIGLGIPPATALAIALVGAARQMPTPPPAVLDAIDNMERLHAEEVGE